MPGPYAVKIRHALEAIDSDERAKGSCDRCKKPFSNAEFYRALQRTVRIHGKWRRQTREEAGLCVCPPPLSAA